MCGRPRLCPQPQLKLSLDDLSSPQPGNLPDPAPQTPHQKDPPYAAQPCGRQDSRRCRANTAHIRQQRPNSEHARPRKYSRYMTAKVRSQRFQVKSFKPFKLFPLCSEADGRKTYRAGSVLERGRARCFWYRRKTLRVFQQPRCPRLSTTAVQDCEGRCWFRGRTGRGPSLSVAARTSARRRNSNCHSTISRAPGSSRISGSTCLVIRPSCNRPRSRMDTYHHATGTCCIMQEAPVSWW